MKCVSSKRKKKTVIIFFSILAGGNAEADEHLTGTLEAVSLGTVVF